MNPASRELIPQSCSCLLLREVVKVSTSSKIPLKFSEIHPTFRQHSTETP